MERKKNIRTYIIVFLLIMYTVGIIGHLIESLQTIMFLLTPFTLLLTGGLVLLTEMKYNERKLFVWFCLSYLFTFIIEVFGVKTGFIFGEYIYGKTLGIKVFNVPLIIGFNWVLVILGAINISKKGFKSNLLIAFASGILAVFFDFLLEPVAIIFDYWNWNNNIIPLQNYTAWFFISFILAYSFLKAKLDMNTDLPAVYFIIQAIFFLVLQVTL